MWHLLIALFCVCVFGKSTFSVSHTLNKENVSPLSHSILSNNGYPRVIHLISSLWTVRIADVPLKYRILPNLLFIWIYLNLVGISFSWSLFFLLFFFFLFVLNKTPLRFGQVIGDFRWIELFLCRRFPGKFWRITRREGEIAESNY